MSSISATSMPEVVDICTEDVYFYDAERKEDLKEFCEDRNIDNLPAYQVGNDKLEKYTLDGNSFDKGGVDSNEIVQQSRGIFEPEVIRKFADEDNDVIFVQHKGELVGIAHFCDYNEDIVYRYLYGIIHEFESSLRNLLTLEYHKQEAINVLENKDSGYFCRQADRMKKNEGERVYLEETTLKALVTLLHSSDEFRIKLSQEKLTKLRDQVMHEKQFVEHQDIGEDEFDYDKESFKQFNERVITLLSETRRVQNLLKIHRN